MEGVHILQTTYEKSPIILLWIVCIIGSLFVASHYSFEKQWNMAIYWLAVAVTFVFFIWWPMTCPNNAKYKVTLGDDVSYSEFVKRYDVLATDGEILIVTDKGTITFGEK